MKKTTSDAIKLFPVSYGNLTAFAKVREKDIPLVSRFSWRLETNSKSGELEAIADVNGYTLEMSSSSIIRHNRITSQE